MPPTKLRVKLRGIVKKYHAKSGVYTLQPELVNGYPTWKQNTSKNSVWFDISIGRWTIGWTDCLGSDTGGGIFGPEEEDDWPQNLSGWQYADGSGSGPRFTYDADTFPNAGSDVVIEDYSKGKYRPAKPNLYFW